jgi:hypothetical protein
MANQKTRSRKSSNSRTKSKRYKQRGGTADGPSAWSYVSGTVGDGWTQFTNALTLQPGQNASSSHSNNLVPIGKVNAQNAQPMLKPNMSGGKRRKSKSAKGGSWGAVATQAIVPGFLLGAQQLYGKRYSRRHKN